MVWRSFFHPIKRTRHIHAQKRRQNQKSPPIRRNHDSFSSTLQQRSYCWRSLIQQNQKLINQLLRKSHRWIQRRRCCRISRHRNLRIRKTKIRKHDRITHQLIIRIRSRNRCLKKMHRCLIIHRCLRHLKKRQKRQNLVRRHLIMWSRRRRIPHLFWCQKRRIRTLIRHRRKSWSQICWIILRSCWKR